MVVQPSIEEHEALLKRVKALEEELKRLRNEKKETSRSPAEVELQPKTRDRKASRNSWADIYNEKTTLRKHKMLLGQEVETDDGIGVARQVGSARGGGVWFACFDMLGCRTKYCHYCIWCSFSYISWYIVLQKRLVRDCETIVARNQRGDYSRVRLCATGVLILRDPLHSLSPVNGMVYVLAVSAFVFLDAVKVKSRVFVIVVGIHICIAEHQ